MKTLHSVVVALNTYLVGVLQPLGPRFAAELALRPLDVEQVVQQSQRSLTLVTAVNGVDYSQPHDRVRVAMSSVLPYRLDSGDSTGALALNVVPVLLRSLERYDAEEIDGEIRDIDASNLSLHSRSVALWGIRYSFDLHILRLVPEPGASLGQLLQVEDLGRLEEAVGTASTPGIITNTRL